METGSKFQESRYIATRDINFKGKIRATFFKVCEQTSKGVPRNALISRLFVYIA